MMQTFYVTFGQKSPFKDGWVEILAYSYELAREHTFYVFGDKFSMIYSKEKFKPEHFPKGRVGEVLIAQDH